MIQRSMNVWLWQWHWFRKYPYWTMLPLGSSVFHRHVICLEKFRDSYHNIKGHSFTYKGVLTSSQVRDGWFNWTKDPVLLDGTSSITFDRASWLKFLTPVTIGPFNFLPNRGATYTWRPRQVLNAPKALTSLPVLECLQNPPISDGLPDKPGSYGHVLLSMDRW